MLRFLDNAGIGALTAAGEWYHDRQSHTLYMVGNGTHPPPSEAVASQGTTVLRQVSVCVCERERERERERETILYQPKVLPACHRVAVNGFTRTEPGLPYS